MNRSKTPHKDFVVLTGSKPNIKIVGELVIDAEECVVEGVLEGMTVRDGFARPEKLQGKASRRQSVWIDQLVNFRRHSPAIRLFQQRSA